MTRAIEKAMPELDILYLGDTLHVPYGKRSPRAVYKYTRQAMDYMFSQDCRLIIIACNTASASALRQLQQIYLPKKWPDRRILGVVVPTLEVSADKGYKKIGLLGTSNIVESGIYEQELRKIDPQIKIYSQAAPLLVPLIEDGGIKYAHEILQDYLAPLVAKNVESIMLGCTHYPFLKDIISGIANEKRPEPNPEIHILSQDDLIPPKLAEYFARHPEIDKDIGRSARREYQVTDLTRNYQQSADNIYGRPISLELVRLPEAQWEDDYIPDLERASV